MTKVSLLICKNNNRLIFFRISRNFWNIKHFFSNNSVRLFLLHLIQKNSFQNRWNWYGVSCCEKNKIISGKLLWLKSPSEKTSISIFYWTLWCVQSFFALTQWDQNYFEFKLSDVPLFLHYFLFIPSKIERLRTIILLKQFQFTNNESSFLLLFFSQNFLHLNFEVINVI